MSRLALTLAIAHALTLAIVATPLPAAVSSKTALVGSQHDLSITGSGPVKSTGTEACIFCHAPHNVTAVTPLWNHGPAAPTAQTYTPYNSSTYNAGTQTPGAGSSKLCLSCHDGTIAMGLTITKGLVPTTGAAGTPDILTTNLSNSHPVSMKAVDDGSLALTLFATPAATKDPAVQLVLGKTECTTCHDPHAPRNDPVVPMFLARSNLNGVLCLACHDPSRAQPNFLNGWTTGAHATAINKVSNAALGTYPTVGNNACWSCHNAHNNGVGPRSLKAADEVTPTSATGPCATCHGVVTTNITASAAPAVLNIMSEYAKAYAHPTLTVTGVHDPSLTVEPIPVNNTRHSECADCHNPHTSALQATTAVAPAMPADLVGTSGYDTTGVLRPATREYQTCYKCHADSNNKPLTSVYGRTAPRYPAGPMPAGLPVQPPKPADQYNLRLKFTSTIGHNISGSSIMTTTVSSLLPFMLNVNGTSNTSRPMTLTTQLYCIDCHNNNAARSSAGVGPNGPHGSTFRHLLQWDLFQDNATVGGGGGGTGNALCAKCHNLTTIRNERPHDDHNGVGCTTCHDPHGVIGGTPGANRAMQNFDIGVAAPATKGFGYYYVSANSKGCYTVCHNHNHNPETY